ncbi:MAG TPA: formate dehydrogenase subunit delta [Candidatus Binataceae bacterium]|jgi:formate dehydrogenase subunit delta|nr:formate dehydrogenase subunit delta [Candidatus Binataceae bacterium]
MDIHHLARMANQISDFFESAMEHEAAVTSTATHLRNFWEPRMRREIVAYAKSDGAELSAVARAAVLSLD